jgi:hypothetical protein
MMMMMRRRRRMKMRKRRSLRSRGNHLRPPPDGGYTRYFLAHLVLHPSPKNKTASS